ncbi:MAG: TonB-dependent receptor [Bacteroidota bacterium]
MKKLLILIVLCLFYANTFATNYTISGFIKDAKSGEALIGASIYIKELKKGVAANTYGFYSITLTEGTYTISYSYIGYVQQDATIQVNKEIRMNIDMKSLDKQIEEVTITSKRADKNVESSDMGKVELKMEDVKKLPALLGEVDIMRTIQLLPGVMSAGEGNSGFYVRGGGPDQNLVLLDNAVVYNPGHLFGFFSIFNGDIIKNTTLIKGGMPANYGGRSSSVLDISMKEGNMKKWHADGGVGILASRLTIQGPIKKDKCSIILSGRRTYIDLISKPILKKVKDGQFQGNTYYFYDLNGKINFKFSDKDRIYISGYYGKDVFKFKPAGGSFNADLKWGNATATLRWNHLFSDKLFLNTSLVYNQYNFDALAGFSDIEFKLKSGVRDINGMVDFDYFPSILHAVKFGFNYTNHTFTPSTTTGKAGETTFNAQLNKKKYAHEYAAYLLDDIAVTDWLKINVGARISGFTLTGPYKKVFKNFGDIDTIQYLRKDILQNYGGFEPRISARFRINKNISIKAGITVNKQYMHLVSRSTTTLPFDVWVPSTERTKPQTVIQYAVGYFQNFKSDMFETSIEAYYKDLRNQVEYGESYVSQIDQDEENGFTYGKGQAYGVEFFVKKAKGKFTGWIGYTLSYTWRKFPELNNGNKFPAKFDRRHDISVVLQYDITKRLNISTVFVYGTGNTTTMPIGRYFVDGQIVNEYGARNGYRLPAYHRWDISLTYVIKDKKWYSDINFSIYNVYSRQNPFFIFNDIQGSTSNGDLTIKSKQVSLFPILPSITWNFKI